VLTEEDGFFSPPDDEDVFELPGSPDDEDVFELPESLDDEPSLDELLADESEVLDPLSDDELLAVPSLPSLTVLEPFRLSVR
jgi:hypothetical protein